MSVAINLVEMHDFTQQVVKTVLADRTMAEKQDTQAAGPKTGEAHCGSVQVVAQHLLR